jgi:hypothetical protein
MLGHVKLIIWFSDTDFQKNDEGGRVFNFCIYMHIGPIFRFHFIDSYHSELPEVTTSYNQRKTQRVFCPGVFVTRVSVQLFIVQRTSGVTISVYCTIV